MAGCGCGCDESCGGGGEVMVEDFFFSSSTSTTSSSLKPRALDEPSKSFLPTSVGLDDLSGVGVSANRSGDPLYDALSSVSLPSRFAAAGERWNDGCCSFFFCNDFAGSLPLGEPAGGGCGYDDI